MTDLIHTSTLGAIHINGVGVVEPGVVFTVDDVAAGRLLEQADIYQLAGKKPTKSEGEH